MATLTWSLEDEDSDAKGAKNTNKKLFDTETTAFYRLLARLRRGISQGGKAVPQHVVPHTLIRLPAA